MLARTRDNWNIQADGEGQTDSFFGNLTKRFTNAEMCASHDPALLLRHRHPAEMHVGGPHRHRQECSQKHSLLEIARNLKTTQELVSKMENRVSTYSRDGILHSTEDVQITVTLRHRRISQRKALSREDK